MLAISEFLTPTPVTIQADENLSHARKLMETNHVRHLPVYSGTELVGVISERDLYMVMGISECDWRTQRASLGMNPNPLRVALDAEAKKVAEEMVGSKRDCALVEDDAGRLVGIFTDTDALKAFALLLEDHERTL